MANSRPVSRVVVGFDGSHNARRALKWLARWRAPRDGQTTVVCILEPMRVPSMAILPASVRGKLLAEAAKLKAETSTRMRRAAEAASAPLVKAGWHPRVEVREGMPEEELLRAVRDRKADLLVVGARGVTGVERLLLGSVAGGVMNHAKIPVTIVR